MKIGLVNALLMAMLSPAAIAQPGNPFVPCVETMAINSRYVFVGTIVETHELVPTGPNTNVVVAVEKRLKGDVSSRTQARIIVPASVLADWKVRQSRLLIFNGDQDIDRAIELSNTNLKVLTTDMKVLTRPGDVIEAAERAIARHPGVFGIYTVRRTVPPEVARMLGDNRPFLMTTLPANSDTERWAVGALRSSDVNERAEGAEALWHFHSEANITRLKSLLDDLGLVDGGNGTQVYVVRMRAFESLRRLGVNVAEPVFRKGLRPAEHQ